MPGIHVQNQIGYTCTVMTLNSHFSIHCIFSVVCVALHNTIIWFLNHLKYKLLNCLTFDAFWMLAGKEFQTEAPDNVNEWRNVSCLGLGVYIWYVEEDRRSREWIWDVKVLSYAYLILYSLGHITIHVLHEWKTLINKWLFTKQIHVVYTYLPKIVY